MRKYLIASLLAVAVLSGSASASLISGDIGFAGEMGTTPFSGDLATATGVDIVDDKAIVTVSTGDFAAKGITKFVDVAVFNDFVFAPFSTVAPLWTVGGFSFDLTSINVILQSADFLDVRGIGIVKHDDFAPTPGAFTFVGNGPDAVFSFASVVSSIPEPTSLLVWGGLAMAGIVARRRRKS